MTLYALGDAEPQVPENGDFWVAPGAHVIGRVRLGAGVGIWFGAVLRGDNELIDIGAGTNVQEGVTIHTDMGYPATIGADCTIGMGATILNGARIGRNCLVGANALVTEGKAFPDNSLIVGAPAKAIRTLDDKAAEALARSAEHYVANWRRFARDLRPL